MKLLRHGPLGAEKPGVMLNDGSRHDLSAHLPDITASTLTAESLAALAALDPATLPLIPEGTRLGVPLAGIGNILCVGLNYRAHAQEAGMPIPAEPILFSKHTAALSGPCDPVRLPPGSTRSDWEVELAAVIARPVRAVSEAEALSYVGGYMVANDVSERAFQLDHGGQWIKGKSADTFCPLGPVLTPAEQVPDPQALRLWLTLNGESMQDSTTADMIFSLAEIISYTSHFMTLLPGDVILTGTPQGVGMGRGRYLQPGDTMRLGVEGLGEITQTVITA